MRKLVVGPLFLAGSGLFAAIATTAPGGIAIWSGFMCLVSFMGGCVITTDGFVEAFSKPRKKP